MFEDGFGTPGTVCFLELGSWVMVDSIVDRVEARGKFRGCLATHVPSTKAQFLYLGMLTLGMTPVHLRIRLQYA